MLVKSVNGYATDGVTPGGEEKVLLARDVIAVAPNSTMRALYIVDNPSTWIVHCHIGEDNLVYERFGHCLSVTMRRRHTYELHVVAARKHSTRANTVRHHQKKANLCCTKLTLLHLFSFIKQTGTWSRAWAGFSGTAFEGHSSIVA
jgi:hypothetical protein